VESGDQLTAQEIVPNAGLLNAKLPGRGALAGLLAMAPTFRVRPGTIEVMPDAPAVNVAWSPLREIIVTVVRFSTKTWTMKFVPKTLRWTRQVGAGLLGVVNVSGSERGDRLPALSNAVTATV
jgi:hypothetical protein